MRMSFLNSGRKLGWWRIAARRTELRRPPASPPTWRRWSGQVPVPPYSRSFFSACGGPLTRLYAMLHSAWRMHRSKAYNRHVTWQNGLSPRPASSMGRSISHRSGCEVVSSSAMKRLTQRQAGDRSQTPAAASFHRRVHRSRPLNASRTAGVRSSPSARSRVQSSASRSAT